MTANAEIILEERKGVLAIPEGAIIYKKDKSTEVEVPDRHVGEGTAPHRRGHRHQQRIEDRNPARV